MTRHHVTRKNSFILADLPLLHKSYVWNQRTWWYELIAIPFLKLERFATMRYTQRRITVFASHQSAPHNDQLLYVSSVQNGFFYLQAEQGYLIHASSVRFISVVE